MKEMDKETTLGNLEPSRLRCTTERCAALACQCMQLGLNVSPTSRHKTGPLPRSVV